LLELLIFTSVNIIKLNDVKTTKRNV